MSTTLRRPESGGSKYMTIEGILSFFVSSSIFIATMCFLAACFASMLYGMKPNFVLLLSAFFTMFTIYSFNKLTDTNEDLINRPERIDFIIGKEEKIKRMSVISLIIALIFGFYNSIFSLPVILFPFISGYLYSEKIFTNIPRLKDITGVKSIVVALAWAVLVALLPIVDLKILDIQIVLLFYFIFIKLFVNTVLFDVRDLEGDKKSNTNTIPVVLGLSNTKRILLLVHSTLLPWLMISLFLELFTRYLIVLIFAIAYGYYHIFRFCTEKSTHKKDLSFDLIIDGEWIPITLLATFFYI